MLRWVVTTTKKTVILSVFFSPKSEVHRIVPTKSKFVIQLQTRTFRSRCTSKKFEEKCTQIYKLVTAKNVFFPNVEVFRSLEISTLMPPGQKIDKLFLNLSKMIEHIFFLPLIGPSLHVS